MGYSVCDRSVADGGGGVSRDIAFWGDDLGGNVWGAFPISGNRLFLSAGDSDSLGGLCAQLL